MANYTKKILAQTLQELMKEKLLDDITVQELIERSSMNRKTFYYHFHNIAELLKWIIKENFSSVKTLPIALDTWNTNTINILTFIKENKFFFHSIHYSRYCAEIRMYLKLLLDEDIDKFVAIAWEFYTRNSAIEYTLTEANQNYIVKYYSGAIYSLLEEWLLGGMKEPIDDFVDILVKLVNHSMYQAFDSLSTTVETSSLFTII